MQHNNSTMPSPSNWTHSGFRSWIGHVFSASSVLASWFLEAELSEADPVPGSVDGVLAKFEAVAGVCAGDALRSLICRSDRFALMLVPWVHIRVWGA